MSAKNRLLQAWVYLARNLTNFALTSVWFRTHVFVGMIAASFVVVCSVNGHIYEDLHGVV